ncbi:MAG: hypothetical protein EOO88_39860 [Pedobacter sp.]|nr:MAG: hypothetical protein EOO88_39860 [Pedobacter sp.]
MGNLIIGRYTGTVESQQDTNAAYLRAENRIEVLPSWILNISNGQSTSTSSLQLDESGATIARLNYSAGLDFTLNPRTKYIVVSGLAANMNAKVITVKKAVGKVANEQTLVQRSAENIKFSAVDNLADMSNRYLSSLDINTGAVIQIGANQYTLPLIRLKKIAPLLIKYVIGVSFGGNGLAFYRADYTFIEYKGVPTTGYNIDALSGGAAWYVIDPPADAVFARPITQIRSDTTQNQIDNYIICYLEDWLITLLPNIERQFKSTLDIYDIRKIIRSERVIDNRPVDKILLTLGDSNSANNNGEGSWKRRFNGTVRPKQSLTRANGGATLTDIRGLFGEANATPLSNTNANTAIAQLENYIKGFNEGLYLAPDIIISMFGTNDKDLFRHLTPAQMGAIPYDECMEQTFMTNAPSYNTLIPLENVDKGKIAGAMRYLVERVATVFPNCIFIACTPIQSTIHNQLSSSRVCRDIRWAAQRLSIPLIDCDREIGMPMIRDYGGQHFFLADGTHTFGPEGQTIGSDIWGKFMSVEFLKKYIPR